MSIPAMAFNGTFSFCPPSAKKLFQHNASLEQRSGPLWVEKVESSRRWFGMKMLVAALPISNFFPNMVLAAETTSSSTSSRVESKNTSMAEAWNSYRGDGFAMKIPPGFEDILGPEEPLDDDSLYGERAKPKPFMARFASSDRLAVLSVVVRPASQLKLSFFEVKDVTDLGSPKEAAKVFLPAAARSISAKAVKSSTSSKTYYFYDFLVQDKHVTMSTAVANGQVYALGGIAPQSKWKDVGTILRSAAASFSLR